MKKWILVCLLAAFPLTAHTQPRQVIANCGSGVTLAPGDGVNGFINTVGQDCVAATATATTTATASATPTAVSAGTGKPLNIDLFSELFVQPAFGGQVVDGTHGLPTNCIAGCVGGPADESAFTFGTTPTFTGGVFQTTATNNALTNGQLGLVQMTANRAFFVNLRNASGAELGVAAAPVQVSLANTGANSNKILVTPDSVALPANQSVNESQINGVTPLMGNGVTGTGSQRVTVASDNTPFAVKVDQTTDGTTNGVRQTTQYPSGAVAETASATGTTGATTATLATNSGQTTFICGFSIRANATAAATGNATVTGTITATMNFTQWTPPTASGLGVTEMIFTPCIPASGTNQTIAVVSAAPGTGGVVSVSAWGFLK